MILIALTLLAAACGGDGVATPTDTDTNTPDVDPDADTDTTPDADADPDLSLTLTGGEESPYVINETEGVLNFEAACAPEECVIARCTIGVANEAPRLLTSCDGTIELDTTLLDREGTWTLTAEAEFGLERKSASRTFEVLYAFEAGLEGLSPGESYTYSHPPELTPFCTRADTCTIEHRCEDESGTTIQCEDLAIPAAPSVTIVLTACATNTELEHCLAEQRYTFIYESPTWVDVSAGEQHTCGILDDGTLWCWGSNGDGRLGDGSSTPRSQPTRVAGDGVWTQVSAGGLHTCGIKDDGSLWCWGDNATNQVSTEPGNLARYSTPHRIGTNTNWSTVTTGSEHSCALQTDGALFCWGYNAYQQLGPGISTQGRVRINSSGTTIDTFVAVAAGDAHTCAVTAEGANGWCWGNYSSGQLNGGTSGDSAPRPVGLPVSGANYTTTTIAAGGAHSCAFVSSDFNPGMYCWGGGTHGGSGQVGHDDPPYVRGILNLSSINIITTGSEHTCAIAANEAYCWGDNSRGQLGFDLTFPTNAISTADPTLITAPREDWTAIAAGHEHTCGIAGGIMRCWGRNQVGQLGDPAVANQTSTPTPVAWPYTP
ncbi:hypothetical protein DV096_12325 [Bradymonadaceae bacterium TMQ3]|nr:hypothetical protein DV096_12325 [Bradymonadaceae bacterium TMQ3]